MVDRLSSFLLHRVKGSLTHQFWIRPPEYSLLIGIPSMEMASRRKRALTMPLTKPARIFWRRQKCVDQSQSILFRKLPLEVRELIYEYTYFPDRLGVSACREGFDVHVFSHSRKLVWRRCSNVDGSCTPHCYRKFDGHSPLSLNLLAVVLTCRRINLTAITSFVSTVLPQRLNCIQSLRLEWIFRDYDIDYPYGTGAAYSDFVNRPFDRRWEALWKVLAGMTGLRKLHVKLGGNFRNGPTWEDQIFEPMRHIEGVQKFEVEANWMVRASSVGPFRLNIVSKTSAEGHWED